MHVMRSLSAVLALLGFVACATSSSPSGTSTTDPAAVAPPVEHLSGTLGVGDVIEIRVFREPDLAGVFRVTRTGAIEMPLIGTVQLMGREPDEVASEIRSRLAAGYLKEPQVAVFVREHNSQKVYVLGQVAKPGTFPYEDGMSIIQAITNAGGFTRLASTNGVTVTRAVGEVERRFSVPVGDIGSGKAPNFTLQQGDIIFVQEALF
jgi:polysaccharide export outer membrane protein